MNLYFDDDPQPVALSGELTDQRQDFPITPRKASNRPELPRWVSIATPHSTPDAIEVAEMSSQVFTTEHDDYPPLRLLSFLLILVMAGPVRGQEDSAPREVREAWEQHYQDLDREVTRYRRKGMPLHSKILDRSSLILPGDNSPAQVVVRRTAALLNHMRQMPGAPELSGFDSRLAALEEQLRDRRGGKALYLQACRLRRDVALANPLLDFDDMIFVTKRGSCEGVLQCWDYGYGVDRGGGLFRAKGIKTGQPEIQDILADAVVENGRLRGRKLSGQGAFNLAALDYDGSAIAFSHVEKTGIRLPWPRDVLEAFTEQTCFHLFTVSADGSRLRQLTDGRRNDYHPCFLPSGRIAFVSDRRNVMDRCQGGEAYKEFSQPCGTLHSMKRDGSDLLCLSYHETTELFPSVDNNGMLVYTRWDYVDRDFCAAHHLWTCYPDGRDPRAPHGNYPYPHHTFEGQWKDGRSDRPWAEYCIRAIPESRRYIAVAGEHHASGPYGTLVLVDTAVEDDNRMSQVTRFHNYELMEESEYQGFMDKGLPPPPMYTDPWPLSEAFVIAVRENRVYLLDRFGNQELLFAASQERCGGFDGVRSAIPLKPRQRPPVLPTMTHQGERYGSPEHQRATIGVVNVYDADFKWPPNTTIKAIRVMQLFPYPWHSPFENRPRIGPGSGVNARAALGVAPVEEDGSAYFEAPVEKAVYFQALDENGMAVQSMRSATYVHPGEQMVCRGCHENRTKTPAQKRVPLAFRRSPSKLVPNLADGSCPLTYARLVEPVLVGKCYPCHERRKKDRPDLGKYSFYFHGTGGDSGCQPIHGGYRTIAGRFGAIESGLARLLLEKHHREALTMAEINRVTLWADANSNELGAYHDEDKQREGRVVWPLIDMDPRNPAGLDLFPGAAPPPTPGAETPLMKQNEALIKAQWPPPRRS